MPITTTGRKRTPPVKSCRSLVLSQFGNSLRKTAYFDPAAVARWRADFRKMRTGSLPRLSVEMGLMAVAATQLWHHLFMGGGLAELPEWSAIRTPAASEAASGSIAVA